MRFKFTLTHTSGSTVITLDPVQWDEIELFVKRDRELHGLFFNFAAPLQFFNKGGGREFIEGIYDTDGIDAQIDILVEIDCNDTGTFTELFPGKLNLPSITQDDEFLSCNIEDKGVVQIVKSRMNTKIDLNSLTTLDGTALTSFTKGPYDLTLHSKNIRATSELDDNLSDNHDFSIGGAASPIVRLWCQVPYTMIKNEIEFTFTPPKYTNAETLPSDISTQNNSAFHDTTGQDPLLVPGTYALDWDFTGDFSDTISSAVSRIVGSIGSGGIDLALFYGQDRDNTNVEILGNIAGYSDSTTNKTIAFAFTGTANITINPDDKLWLIWVINGYVVNVGTGPFDVDITFDHSGGGSDSANLEFTIDSLQASSTCKAFVLHEAFARIAQSITDQTDAYRSTLTGRKTSQPDTYDDNGCASFTATTNGYQIRKFTLTEHPLSMSWNDLFKAVNAQWNIGMAVEDGGSGQVIRVERKDFFYDSSTTLLTLINIVDLVQSEDSSLYFNDINIGYQKWESEDINGIDEFATKHQYTTSIKTVSNKIDALCSFVVSGYSIEITRRKRFETTKDFKYDTDNFFVALNRSVDGGGAPNNLPIAEKNENFTTINNYISPSTGFNFRYTPKRNLLRWTNVISGGLAKKVGEDITFQFGEGNIEFESQLMDTNCPGDFNNTLIAENDDVQWDGVNVEEEGPIWEPIIFDFTYPLDFTDYLIIKANPTKAIKISETATDLITCYILEVAYRPVDGIATFKLIKAG